MDGTEINLYDDEGIRVDSQAWTFEGEWNENGATCVSDTRIAKLAKVSCKKQLRDKTCGNLNNFNNGTLIMSEFKPK